MRNSELKTGIEVFDEKGEVVGTSKVAAKKVSQDVLCVCVAKGPMHFIVVVKCVNAFIVVVKCGRGNHTAFPLQTGAATTEDMVQCHVNVDYVVCNIRMYSRQLI